MKIDDDARVPKPLPAAVQAHQTRRARQASKAYARSADAPAAPAPADRVEVSAEGRAMQVAMAALKQAPETRADRVAELKARISDGTYQVPAEDVAERMLADDVLG
jgi:flagellar biosynthesis anti-sigma factor FlgM